MRSTHILATIIVSITLLTLWVTAIPIDPHTYENIGPACIDDKRLWRMKVNGNSSRFQLVTYPCNSINPSNITIHVDGVYTSSNLLLTCEKDEMLCIYIHNVNDQRAEIRYEIEDITDPPNVYIPLFYVAVGLGIMASLLTFLTCFGLGIYVGRKAKAKVDIKLFQTDEQTMHYYLAKADNLDQI
jgi:hypothetical protein